MNVVAAGTNAVSAASTMNTASPFFPWKKTCEIAYAITLNKPVMPTVKPNNTTSRNAKEKMTLQKLSVRAMMAGSETSRARYTSSVTGPDLKFSQRTPFGYTECRPTSPTQYARATR